MAVLLPVMKPAGFDLACFALSEPVSAPV